MDTVEGLPWWLSGKELACQCRRHRFNPWVRKIPWRRAWQPLPVFLPGESHGQRSLVGYSPWGHKNSDKMEQLTLFHFHYSTRHCSRQLRCHHIQSNYCYCSYFMWHLEVGQSVQFSHSVVSNSLRPQESQHARPPHHSPTPGVHSNSCASSQ